MNIIRRSQPETGHSIKTSVFDGNAGFMLHGTVKTPSCIVEVQAIHATPSYGYLCCNFNGRYYQVNFDDRPSANALVRRAHRMMKQVLGSIQEETYRLK